MNLNEASSITAVLAGAPNSVAPYYISSFESYSFSGPQCGTLSAVAATIVPAPRSGTQTKVQMLNIYNADDASITLTVSVVVSGTSYTFWSGTLSVGDCWQYSDHRWSVLDSQGRTKTSGTLAPTFSGATATNLLSMPDNLADALSIQEGANKYITFDTTNSAEAIRLKKATVLTALLTLLNATGGVGASTAAAGNAVGNGGALPAGTGLIYPTTAADDTKGVVIDVADKVTGRVLFIGNGVSNKILKVYGPSGASINGAAGDAAFSSASGKGVLIVCLSGAGNTWLAM